MTPELDAARRSALAHLTQGARTEARRSPSTLEVVPAWRVLLGSCRWHLAGLSATWVVILVLNFGASSGQAPAVGKGANESPRQIMTALLEKRRLLLELIGPSTAEPAALALPPVPPRRSQIVSSNFLS